jgi:FkbM family methyltransferase
VDYPLDQESVVFDVGGFEGQWASDIFARYLCRIHVFEPIPHFAARIARRFASNERIKVHPRALGAIAGELAMTIQGDESSAQRAGEHAVSVKVVTPEAVFQAESIREVALMKLNIEGGEYDLIEHILEAGLIGRIQRLQVQFHDFVPDAESRMRAIRTRLGATHRPRYQYTFVWEDWRRKDLVD